MKIPVEALKPLKEAKVAFERDYLIRLLQLYNGNVTKCARACGRYRKGFYDLMKKHGLLARNFRKSDQGGRT